MNKINKEDILKLAQLSRIDIEENEIEDLHLKINAVLEYASFLEDIVKNKEFEYTSKFINIYEEDQVQNFDSKKILEDAPEKENNYFVVPRIINN